MDKKRYEQALQYRPVNIQKLFPKSKALIVSGKAVHAAMLKMREKGQHATAIAANGRNEWVIEGVLRAAARTNSAVIIEIAKSESGYCEVNSLNLAQKVNNLMEKLGLQVVVAIHADHYGIKKEEDFNKAKTDIPKLIEAGTTSFAIDASHMPHNQNVLYNIELGKIIPTWMSMETEVGEIKGDIGLSTVEEALFHIKALNANGIFPVWIALNNGTVHGLKVGGGNIHVGRTAEIHAAIQKYGVYGAQHGTSGNNYDKLRDIVQKTNTTKTNVATALQMISWGLKVNEFGNAELDGDKNFIKIKDLGVTDEAWQKMIEIAKTKGWKGNDYKNLNKDIDPELKKLPKNIQDRMVKGVEDFVTNLFVNIFNSSNTADLAVDALLEAKSPEIKLFDKVLEDKKFWTVDYINKEGQRLLEKQNEATGNFDD
ncbi:MAG: class II fructose-bisphosphate aldolase [Candidatus Wallbacteria bacterium]|nr:class II fructose-bisphosphate aldolase [Candidatus Wallbacteria bacterium]